LPVCTVVIEHWFFTLHVPAELRTRVLRVDLHAPSDISDKVLCVFKPAEKVWFAVFSLAALLPNSLLFGTFKIKRPLSTDLAVETCIAVDMLVALFAF